MPQVTSRFVFLVTLILSFFSVSSHAIPAFLPQAKDVNKTQEMAIDGVWLIDTIGKKIRIEAGRAYAVDGWLHLFVLSIDPGMVVIRGIERTIPGEYSGEDLPLLGRWHASLQEDRSLSVTVAGSLGPVKYKLIPVKPDNTQQFDQEMVAAGLIEAPPNHAVIPSNPPTQASIHPFRQLTESVIGPRGTGSNDSSNDRVCSDKGGEGEYLCTKIEAIDHGKMKFGCKGRQLYLSDGACYECPDDYKRASLTRKMNHPDACQERGFNKQVYTSATMIRDAFGCAPGQFLKFNNCKSCPPHSKRIHIGGVDFGKCKVDKAYHCMDDLVPTKLKPDGLITRTGNYVGAKIRKRCAPPFNINSFVGHALIDSPAGPLMVALSSFSARLLLNDSETRDKASRLRDAVKQLNIKKAWEILQTIDEFELLVQSAYDAGHFIITIGASVDGSLILGYEHEQGIAIDLVEGKLKGYTGSSLSKGILSGGYDIGLTLGLWEGPFQTDYAQGWIVETNLEGGAGIGAWSSYFNPGAPRSSRYQHLIGFTVSAGPGISFELGEYDEVYTKVISECSFTDLDQALNDNVLDIAKLLIGQDC